MSDKDKDKEIHELRERLDKLEGSNKSEHEQLKDMDSEKLTLKMAMAQNKAGCFANIIFIILIVAGALWFFMDDSDGSSATADTEVANQKTAPIVDKNKQYRSQIVASLAKQDYEAYWGQDSSLWIENPGFSAAELETFGYKLCDITKNFGMKQSYIITFWQSLRNGPKGQILKVKCF